MKPIKPTIVLAPGIRYALYILLLACGTGCTKEALHEVKNAWVEEHLQSHSYKLALKFPDYALAHYDMAITVQGKKDNAFEWLFDEEDTQKPLAPNTPVSKTAYVLKSPPGHTKSIRIWVYWKRKSEHHNYLVVQVSADRNGALYKQRSISNQPAAGQPFPSSGTLELIID